MAAGGQLVVVDEFEHRATRDAHHRDDETALHVVAVVGIRVVDDVAAGFPEGFARADDTWWLPPLEFKEHLAFQHVTERRAARMPVRRGSGAAGRILDDDGHHVGTLGNERRVHVLHHG